MADPMKSALVITEEIGDITVVRFVDKRLTELPIIEKIGGELARLVEERDARKLLLDFSNVAFMSSRMLGKLTVLLHQIHKVDGKLVLCGISAKIMEVFRLTALDKLLKIVADERAGLRAF